MNIKTIFGSVLTVLGIIGLIYATVQFANNSHSTKTVIISFIVGLIFFISGIGLIKNIKDS